MQNDDWLTIVEPMARDEAERALSRWLDAAAASGSPYPANQIRQDVILGENRKTLVRFSIRANRRNDQ